MGTLDPVPAAVLPLFDALSRSPDPVFVTDRRNRIVSWNTSAERLFGFTEEEALGMQCASMLQGCDSHGNRYCSDNCPVTQLALRNETVRNFELRLVAKGGHEILAEQTRGVIQIDREFLLEAHIASLRTEVVPHQVGHLGGEKGECPPRRLVRSPHANWCVRRMV